MMIPLGSVHFEGRWMSAVAIAWANEQRVAIWFLLGRVSVPFANVTEVLIVPFRWYLPIAALSFRWRTILPNGSNHQMTLWLPWGTSKLIDIATANRNWSRHRSPRLRLAQIVAWTAVTIFPFLAFTGYHDAAACTYVVALVIVHLLYRRAGGEAIVIPGETNRTSSDMEPSSRRGFRRIDVGMLLAMIASSFVQESMSYPVLAQVTELHPANSEAFQSTGAGEWQSREPARGKRGWQIEIERFGDGAVAGRVRLFGSPFERAQLVGRVDGDDVYGVLLDDDGRQIGTFSGAVFTNALSGTYRMVDGDEGAWAWNGEHAVRAIKDPAAAIRGSEHSR